MKMKKWENREKEGGVKEIKILNSIIGNQHIILKLLKWEIAVYVYYLKIWRLEIAKRVTSENQKCSPFYIYQEEVKQELK
jgi:hypothetical protein